MSAEPITPITLENAEGRKAAFMPQSDMTALESALLTQLFVKMILNRSGQPLDWEGYLATHGLARHFAWGTPQPNWQSQGGQSAPPVPGTTPIPAQLGDRVTGAPTKTIVAARDLPGVTKGTKLQVLADMPVLDGWVEEKAA